MPLVPAYRCDQELSFRQADYLGRCPLVPRMAQKEHDRRPEPLKPEEAAELEKALQSDDIAPVDQKTFGMQLAEIIIRVRNLGTPRQRK